MPSARKKRVRSVEKAGIEEEELAAELFGREPFQFDVNEEDDSDDVSNNDRNSTASGSGELQTQLVRAESPSVWADEDDALLDVNIAATKRLKKLRGGYIDSLIDGSELEKRLRRRFLESQQDRASGWARLPKSSNHKSSKETKGITGKERGDSEMSGEDDDVDVNFGDDADDDVDHLLRTTSSLRRGHPNSTRAWKNETRGSSVVESDFSESFGGSNRSNSSDSGRPSPSMPIRKGTLDVLRCKDANAAEQAQAVVRACAFHPRGELLLAAGLDKRVRFFQVDGDRNRKLHACFLDDLPITAAAWTNGGNQVILAGRRPFFYIYDVESGLSTKVPGISGRSEKSLERFAVSSDGKMTAFTLKGGTVAVVDNRTERTSIQVKMNGTARCVTFAPRPQENSHYLVTSGGDAEVYVWDLRYARGIGSSGTGGHRCLSKWANEGGMPTCGLASSSAYSMFHSSALHSKSNSLRGGPLAVASESGVVNIYHGATDENRGAAPLKCLMNLTTPVETLQFNHDGQLLAMASRWSKNALRIVHLPSATVYSNWPTSKSPLNYVFSLDFSPNSGFLAIGNDKGRVLLYRLRHYSCI